MIFVTQTFLYVLVLHMQLMIPAKFDVHLILLIGVDWLTKSLKTWYQRSCFNLNWALENDQFGFGDLFTTYQ